MLTITILILLVLACFGLVWVLSLAEIALGYISYRQAEDIVATRPKNPALIVVSHLQEHLFALQFWRAFFHTGVALCVTMLIDFFTDNLWLTMLCASLAMLMVAGLHLLFTPRDLASRHESLVVRLTARLVRTLRQILGPIPGRVVASTDDDDTEDEELDEIHDRHFREFISRAEDADIIDPSEADMIQSVVELDDTLVRSVMVPRIDVIWIETGTTLEDALSLFIRSGYSRIPLTGESPDDILGIVYLKDVVRAIHRTKMDTSARVDHIARSISFVPESKTVWSLLQEMQRDSTHVALVIDEYGGTAGVVTLEDLIEEVVGDISDEYDVDDREDVTPVAPGEFLVTGSMSVSDFTETFDLSMDDNDDVDTVRGLFAKHLGRIPIESSTVEIENLRLEVESLEPRRNRVDQIRVWVTERDRRGTDQDPSETETDVETGAETESATSSEAS
ncbi:hemolysin family protein [Auritidibacter ignavus]|uniref:hemolysin family protein n=1 Tax=Auritidibacter ignavus TaxID=678932 RepID=UPI0024BB2C48|nr:hemolysin family protein [Auritidibacter ignavus]WHS34787.1 hemolysin family protein [Auritidibacter ignavus]